MSVKDLIKGILTEKENRRYQSCLKERKITYGEWLKEQERLWIEEPQKGPSGSGLHEDDTREEFVLLCAGAGSLAAAVPDRIRHFFRQHPEALLLYGDEDREDREGNYCDPWFKPDWSPDLLDSCFYFGSLAALRRELFERTKQAADETVSLALEEEKREGILIYRPGDLDAYEQWMHLCVELAGGRERGSRSVGHMSQILFHCQDPEQQERFWKPSPFLKQKALKQQEAFRCPRISVVIPSRDQPEILEKCLRGLVSCAGEKGADRIPLEIIIVDNGSGDQNRERVERLTQDFEKSEKIKVIYRYEPMDFNFSRMCNLGAEASSGELLLFLNDDVELCLPGCVEQLALTADSAHGGAVGMKLYYPDSRRIQHAGITNLPMGPVHKLQFLEDDQEYRNGINRGYRNVLAVTAACLMVKRDRFAEAGGFCEELQVAFNDVDLCFSLYELGYINVCRNDLYAYHHESLSRGGDESAEKLERLLQERRRLYERHPGLEGTDPFYSPHLNRQGLDTRIRPGYVTEGNRIQQVSGPLREKSLNGFRQDNCLMVRAEDCRDRIFVGFAVVLGDNNACYETELLLRQEERMEGPSLRQEERMEDSSLKQEPPRREGVPAAAASAALPVYGIPVQGQYRPDLEENMPDQVRVALCGIWVELKEGVVPKGRYRIGAAARNRVTGLGLVNWTNRFVRL